MVTVSKSYALCSWIGGGDQCPLPDRQHAFGGRDPRAQPQPEAPGRRVPRGQPEGGGSWASGEASAAGDLPRRQVPHPGQPAAAAEQLSPAAGDDRERGAAGGHGAEGLGSGADEGGRQYGEGASSDPSVATLPP